MRMHACDAFGKKADKGKLVHRILKHNSHFLLLLPVVAEELHPALSRIKELCQSNVLTDGHPFFQVIELLSEMLGGISCDSVRGITNLAQRYPGLVYLHERIRESVTPITFTWENTELVLEFPHFQVTYSSTN